MNENIKRKIEFEKKAWEEDIKWIENYRPEKPEEPSVLRAVLLYITILAIVFLVSTALIFISPILAEIIAAICIPADFFIIYGFYTCKRSDYKAWKDSLKYKAEELEKIDRKYTTRIQNLEQFGSYKKKSVCYPDEICLHCGSTNIGITPLSLRPTPEHRILTCRDCGQKELY